MIFPTPVHMLKLIRLPLLLLLLVAATPAVDRAVAQEVPTPRRPAADAELPRTVARAVVDFYNDPRRTRFAGETVFPADSVVTGDIAVLDGPLEIHGRVEGSIVMINGALRLHPGASVTGDILLVGGTLDGTSVAHVGGEILEYPGRLYYRLEEERMVLEPRPRTPNSAWPPDTLNQANEETPSDEAPATGPRLDFLMTTGDSYNRVEGLPITFGPRIRMEGRNPLLLQALAIYRTESGFTSNFERLGYYVRGQQYFGGRREWSAGGTLHSLIAPIEDWHLPDLENGLAAFLFHRDFRDHYEREGVSAFVSWEPGGTPLSLTGEWRWERHRSLVEGSPLTLFDNAEPWRPQPLVGQGRVGSVSAIGVYDTRSEARDPASGWYARGIVEQGFHVDLERPAAVAPLEADPISGAPADRFGRFTTGFMDVRRYNRLSPDIRFNVRALLGGSLTGSPLPPQRQHAFGGEGSLPGYPLLSQDCGARDVVYRRRDEPDAADNRTFPFYGCDGFTLVQAELRGKLDFRFRLDGAPWDDEADGLGFGWDVAPDWVIFVDGATGWAFRDRPDEPLRFDAGAGLLIDRLGVFVAAPLSGGEGFNVFIRLGPRF